MENSILEINKSDDIFIIRVNSKKLYQNETALFREAMLDLIDKGCLYVVMDLSEVRVMNSSALGVILLSADQIKKRNGKFAVGALNPLLKELFERMFLHTLFDVTETPEQAVSLIKVYKKIPAT